MRTPHRVGVLGSCLTRDCFNSKFNPDYKQWFTVSAAANQISLISLMSEPITAEWHPLGDMSSYDRWNIDDDLAKGFLTTVVEDPPDFLVIDLFADIHFGVVQVDGGPWLTDNRWKVKKTDWYVEQRDAGSLRPINVFDDRDEYLRLWRDAAHRLAGFVAANLPDTEIVVNRGRNTSKMLRTTNPRPVDLQRNAAIKKLDVPRANELWRRLDDELTEVLGARQLDLTDVDYPSPEDHEWGPFYVHYTPDYYRRLLTELHRLSLGTTAPPPVMQQVEALLSAMGNERVIAQRRTDELIEELDARQLSNRRLRLQLKELRESPARRWIKLPRRRAAGRV